MGYGGRLCAGTVRFRLVARRTVWLPTFLGWSLLLLALGGSFLLWCIYGETFLSVTDRCPADVLVVEGWIGPEGVKAAAMEFARGNYRYVVGTGGLSGEPWHEERWNFAKEAGKVLRRVGIPADRVLVALTPDEADSQRTYAAALAVRRALRDVGVSAKALNIFTETDHARRSRLVFEKVFEDGPCVGVVSWLPPGYDKGSWWRSSDRAVSFLKESVAYPFEKLFSSGRKSASVP